MKISTKLGLSAAALAIAPVLYANQPNVVFIVVDDMGWMDLEVYGSDFHQTPEINQLAADGVRFTDAYAACTVSSPTRASLMTGKYPATLRVTDWIEGWKMPDAKLSIPEWTKFLPLDELTLAQLFKRKGYNTAHIGKWHLGEAPAYWPENFGFDINIGGWAKGAPYRNKKLGYNGYFTPYGNPRMDDGPEGEYLTERLTSEACAYIQEKKNEPFYLNLWFYNVHTPLQAKTDKVEKYKALVNPDNKQTNPVYAAMVEHVDDAVGEVISALKKAGIYDNTIIILTSDNGGLVGRNRRITNNYPLRSGKGDMYEGGVRVNLIVKNTNQTAKGKVVNQPVISADFVPTLVDICNIPISRNEKLEFDGVSIKPLLGKSCKKLNREAIFWHYPHYHIEGATPHSAIRYGDWKLIQIFETNTLELYNLKDDIGETKNLADQNPKMTNKLLSKLEQWRRDVKAQMPTPNPHASQL